MHDDDSKIPFAIFLADSCDCLHTSKLANGSFVIGRFQKVGGRSANKFCELRTRKFAYFNNLLNLRTFRKCGTLRICDLRTLSFCGFRTSNFLKYILEIKSLQSRLFEVHVWIQSCAVFCRNLRICDLRINHKKIADLIW